MATILDSFLPPPQLAASTRRTSSCLSCSLPVSSPSTHSNSASLKHQNELFQGEETGREQLEFIEKAKARAAKRIVGDPFKQGIEQGPQIDSEQFEKILRYIKSGVQSGATLETGGDRFGSKGYFIQPTVFSNVQDDMLIAKEEIFGPVQSILKFKDLDEVIRRANTTRYGLAAGVFTQNIDTANTLTRALRAGTVWVNCFDVFDAAIPFGGYKMSGQGREKGVYSLSNYLQVKAVVTPLKNPSWL